MSQNTQNSKLSTLAPSAKNSKLSNSTKKVITKATKKAPQIVIDTDSDNEPHYLEEVVNNWTETDFESKYREILFKYNSLDEEHSGAKQEIDGLKFQLGDARKNCLKFNDLITKQETEIKQLKERDEDAENRISHLERTIKNLKRRYQQEKDDNQQLIEERDEAREKTLDLFEICQRKDKEITDLQFKNETHQLTIDNLNTELKDLKIYADDNEKNFFKLNEENKFLKSQCEAIAKDYAKESEENGDLIQRNEELISQLDYQLQKSFYGGSEKTEHEEKIKRLENLIKEKDDSIIGLQLEKEIICKQNEDLSEKIQNLRDNHNRQSARSVNNLKDHEEEIKNLKEKNLKLQSGVVDFGTQILTLKNQTVDLERLKENIKKLINMLEEYEGLGGLSPSMKWTLQCKLETFIKPDFKPTVDYPRHIINLGNGHFY